MSKYRAVKTTVDGITFHSAAEARHYADLKVLERAGIITHLQLQPKYPVAINGVKVFEYRADFAYFEAGKRHVVDVKGMDTPMSRLKRKCVEALYGPNFSIELVRVGRARSLSGGDEG